jgi:cytochrome oxidase Cu insertion factor (SCO1/SenC/PrrC family)
MRRLGLMFLMCLMLGGLGGLLAATVRSPEPARARFTPPRERPFDFQLRDQEGRLTSLARERGKVVAIAFAYTSCRDVCPAEGNEIAAAMGRFDPKDVDVIVVSVDPVGDTPARAREWLMRRGLPRGAGHYVVGTRAQLEPVWRAYGIVPLVASQAEAVAAMRGSQKYWSENPYRPDAPKFEYAYPSPRPASAQAQEAYPDSRDLQYRGLARHGAGWDFEHSAYALLIDKRGVQRVGIPFEQLTADSLARDVRALLAEG